MAGILLAGLTDHEAAAAEILIGMHWRAQRCVILPRSLSLAIPDPGPAGRACDSCLVDLFGLGMRKHSPEHEAELLAFLPQLPGGIDIGFSDREMPANALTLEPPPPPAAPPEPKLMRDPDAPPRLR